MAGIPQTMRFTIDDKYEYAKFKTKLNNKTISAINDAANEAARRINSNADLNTTRELIGIENAAHEIAERQIAAAYIIDSSIHASTNRIVDSIDDLRSLFDARSSETIWQLEQQRKELKVLLDRIYKAIIETDKNKAKAKKDDGIKAYNNKWFDEAIRDFNESINSYSYDFQVYQFLGNIYLFDKKDPKKAIENYNLAARYAEPYDNYYTSLAFLHIGLSKYNIGNFQDAIIAASNSIQKNPEFSEAYYRRAQYCSKLGRYDEAINDLRKAIKADRGYCLKALAERDFEPMSCKLKNLIEDLTKEEKDKAGMELEKSSQLIKKFEYMDVPRDAKQMLEEGINLINAGTYLNYRDAVYKAYVSQKALVDSLIARLSIKIPPLEGKFDELDEKYKTINPILNFYKKTMLISAPFALLGSLGIYLLIYNDYPFFAEPVVNALIMAAEKFNDDIAILLFVCILCPICIFIFIYSLIKYINLFPQRVSNIKISSLDTTLKKYRKDLDIVESEKEKLNIDEGAEKLCPIDYEKYLRKSYG